MHVGGEDGVRVGPHVGEGENISRIEAKISRLQEEQLEHCIGRRVGVRVSMDCRSGMDRRQRKRQGPQRRGAKTPCTLTCQGLFEMGNSYCPIVISGAKMPCTPTCRGLFEMVYSFIIQGDQSGTQLL